MTDDVRLPVYSSGTDQIVGYVSAFVMYGDKIEPVLDVEVSE